MALATTPAAVTNAADAIRVIVEEVALAMPASASPQMISPAFSESESSEWMVARASLGVRRLTRIVPPTRTVGKAMPLTSSAPATADPAVGAWANTTRPTAPIPHAAT